MVTGLRVGGTVQVENGSLRILPPHGASAVNDESSCIRRRLRNWSSRGKVPEGRLLYFQASKKGLTRKVMGELRHLSQIMNR